MLLLLLLGGLVPVFKVTQLGVPWAPDQTSPIWTVEAKLRFGADGKVKAILQLPDRTPGFTVIDEDFVSRDFGLAVEDDAEGRRAIWSARRAHGPQSLYYRIALDTARSNVAADDTFPGYPPVPDYPEIDRAAIDRLLAEVRDHSVDIETFTRQLILKLSQDENDAAVALFRDQAQSEDAWARQIVRLLAGARIPARVVYGLELQHGVLDAPLRPWLEVHNENRWLGFNPRSGEAGYPPDFLIWQSQGPRSYSIDGGRLAELRFSIRRGLRETISLARQTEHPLLTFSLLGLPLHTQNVYTILLTIPLGALLVVLLRNLIGIQTFGTFMPVLIALAFRETELLWGVALFSLVVALGLALRFALEHLKLLLVPRLASVLIIVILLMLMISIGSYRLGFEQGLSVALFPMVILAMTVERMSIVWEEHGPRDAVLQGLGSLVVAALAFLLMNHDRLQYLVSMFPESLLVVLALALMLGRYTGYRLTELWRFRSIGQRTPE